jgi:hypothetical protein
MNLFLENDPLPNMLYSDAGAVWPAWNVKTSSLIHKLAVNLALAQQDGLRHTSAFQNCDSYSNRFVAGQEGESLSDSIILHGL